MCNSKLRMTALIIVGMILMVMPCSQGYTDPQDIFAINYLYLDLGSPPLPGWRIDGDPCLEGWQGVECVMASITGIILNGANLGGQLSESLGNFSSIITIDLSNNHIGGKIPENLPITIRKLILSANQFAGTIPSSLSNLTLLSDMAVNDNLLVGELPDAFQSLTGVVNLDFSSNNLSGQLPPSMGNLLTLTTLHVQNNHLSGALDILQDLPLLDLNIENNLFSGPIPAKLLTIPNFLKDGNPFNTSVPPSSSPASPPVPLFQAPAPSNSHSNNINFHKNKEGISTIKVIAYAAIALASLIVVVLVVIICASKLREKPKNEEVPQKIKHEKLKKPVSNSNLSLQTADMKKAVPEGKIEKQNDYAMDIKGSSVIMMPFPAERLKAEPRKLQSVDPKISNLVSSATSFSVASLQQYTNSFGEENLICMDTSSKTFLGNLPDGKLLTIMKLENVNPEIQTEEYLKLISIISKLHHSNILELVGYCTEYGQRLLVYNYFSKMTLHDILHCDEDFKNKLTWNARIEIALGAARALEYLHENCHPPITHKNFDSSKILLDDNMAVRVSECGIALLTAIHSNQIHGQPNYEAPEVNDFGIYNVKSDIYSFGVVMLELLTGRKPYESSRPREERFLVRWASSQFYDINALSRMVDPSMDGNLPLKSLSWFADIINRCIQQQPEFRPPMSEVVQDLAHMCDDMKMNADRTQPTLL